jgi:hypothetical protein
LPELSPFAFEDEDDVAVIVSVGIVPKGLESAPESFMEVVENCLFVDTAVD